MTKDTKEHILEVSLTLFLQKSYKAVTMKDIVTETGLSKGAFYHYFDSKEQLFKEVVNHYYGKVLQEDRIKPSQESLKAYYNDFIDNAYKVVTHLQNLEKAVMQKQAGRTQNQGMNHYLLLFDAAVHIPEFDERRKKQDEKEFQGWKKIISAAKQKGEIREDISTEKVARMFMYMGDGYGINVITRSWEERELKTFEDLRTIWDSLYQLLKD